MKNTTKKSETKKAAEAPAAIAKETKPAPQPAAPVFTIGQPDLASKRLSQCELKEYRIVPSQRASFKGYFIQGGSMTHDAASNRDLFAVCVEIPHTDLAAAKAQVATLRADKARAEAATAPVIKVAKKAPAPRVAAA